MLWILTWIAQVSHVEGKEDAPRRRVLQALERINWLILGVNLDEQSWPWSKGRWPDRVSNSVTSWRSHTSGHQLWMRNGQIEDTDRGHEKDRLVECMPQSLPA